MIWIIFVNLSPTQIRFIEVAQLKFIKGSIDGFSRFYKDLLTHIFCILMFSLCVMCVHCMLVQRPEEGTRTAGTGVTWKVVSHYVVLGTEPQVFSKRSQCALALKYFSSLCRGFIVEHWYFNSSRLGFF